MKRRNLQTAKVDGCVRYTIHCFDYTIRCDQKGTGTGYGVKASPYIDVVPPADRQNLTHPVI